MKPNIVFILSDDQSYFAQHRENADIITPTLDKLAEDGFYFKNCFCASPVCSPARASILTGTMPSYHGVHDWIISGSVDIDELPSFSRERPSIRDNEFRAIDYLQGISTYTDILAKNGYDIALSGKWHLGDTMKPREGYKYWNTILRGGCRYTSYDMYFNGKITANTKYLTDVITDNAIDYLHNYRTDNPFYLGVHYTAPHTPWLPSEHPQHVWKLYEGNSFSSIPTAPVHPNQMMNDFVGDTEQKRIDNIRGYFTAVTAMDAAIARILEAIKELGLEDNTIIFFTSDNGMNVGQHGVWGKGNGTYPQNFYEESIKVPMIIKIPRKQGKTVTDLISHTDLFPTILDLCGIEGNADKPCGKSFSYVFNGKAFGRKFVSVCSEYGAVRMLRDSRYKYVKNYIGGENQFFDLLLDPGESLNLIREMNLQAEILRMDELMDNAFSEWSIEEHDGRTQFPKGMGQKGRCSQWNGNLAYVNNYRMYYPQHTIMSD